MQINQKQGFLALEIHKQTEIQGIGMGVLKDGTPFLNQRGWRVCVASKMPTLVPSVPNGMSESRSRAFEQ